MCRGLCRGLYLKCMYRGFIYIYTHTHSYKKQTFGGSHRHTSISTSFASRKPRSFFMMMRASVDFSFLWAWAAVRACVFFLYLFINLSIVDQSIPPSLHPSTHYRASSQRGDSRRKGEQRSCTHVRTAVTAKSTRQPLLVDGG